MIRKDQDVQNLQVFSSGSQYTTRGEGLSTLGTDVKSTIINPDTDDCKHLVDSFFFLYHEAFEQYNRVSKVTIGGEEEWSTGLLVKSKKSYKPETPLKIYYRLFEPEVKIKAPEADAEAYIGKKYQIVQKAFTDAYFKNIKLQPLMDLETGDDENDEIVTSVTINGETDWSTTGIFSATNSYEQDAEVIICYHSKKE